MKTLLQLFHSFMVSDELSKKKGEKLWGHGIFKSDGKRVLKSNRIRSKSKGPKFFVLFQILDLVRLIYMENLVLQ